MCALVFLLLTLGGLDLLAQNKDEDPGIEGEAFDKQSLALRTALHYDPSLEAPLKGLVRLYNKAGRLEDLVGLYRAHVAQYGDDIGAKVVMVRLLKELDRAEASELVQAAARQHPENGELKYLLYQDYKKRGDGRALKTLSEAIDLQQGQGRKLAWLEELLAQAHENDARSLAQRHLSQRASAEGHTGATLLVLATQMHRYDFDEMCLETLTKAQSMNSDAEIGVEIDLLAARAEASLGQYDKVAERMDGLLKRLAPDYRRRGEITKLRMSLVKNNAAREELLERAKDRYGKEPLNEGAALDYSELLVASEMRGEAAEVLTEASKRLPKSERLEKEALELLDRIGDERGMRAFLEQRLAQDPKREDLEYRLVKVEYLLGEAKTARKRLEKILGGMATDDDRARRLLDLARFLRKMSQAVESADLLAEVAKLWPARLDVQRELLEALLALEQRAKAGKMLANLPVTDAEIENFIDLVEFMVKADFLVEARRALEGRLGNAGDHLELKLLLVAVLGKTGERNKAEEVLLEARGQADTTARYAQWLESGLALYDLFESPEQFFDSEQFRFLEEGEDWTAERIDRFLTLCELGERKKLGDRVAQALRNQLADASLPDSLKLRLRLLLVRALDKSPDNAGEVEEQLKLLANEDEQHADEYRLRMALLYHSNSRPDLAQELLVGVDVGKVADESILRAAYLMFLEYSQVDSAKVCLAKLTELEPDDSGNWEKRLGLLAALGEEGELRVVLRRLLVGVDRMILKPEVVQALRAHLLDSYWRSIARLLETGDQGAMAEILALLDSVDRDAGQARDRTWSLWARAYVLNQLGRGTARDGVVKELEVFLERDPAELGNGKKGAAMIAFPDGLAVSKAAALALLKSDQGGGDTGELAGEDSAGPLGEMEMGWAFEVDPGGQILQIETLGEKRVLVLDDQGGVYNVDAENGKLQWHERYGVDIPDGSSLSGRSPLTGAGGGITLTNSSFQVRQTGQSIFVRQLASPYQSAQLGPGSGVSPSFSAPGVKKVRSMLVDGEHGFFLSVGNQIRSYRSKDGGMQWQSDLAPVDRMELSATSDPPLVAQPDPVMFVEGDKLLCYAPALDVAACFQKQTGKLLWSRILGPVESSKAMVYSLNSGAVLADGYLFVYGHSCEILDSATGETLWSFDDRGVLRFPVVLSRLGDGDGKTGKAGEGGGGASPVLPASVASTALGGQGASVLTAPLPAATTFVGHDEGEIGRISQLKPFMQGEGVLVAPAVQWNGLRTSGGTVSDARISGRRLLLMGAEGIRAISLALPIASRHYPVKGVWVGIAGEQAWFLDSGSLTKLSLLDGQVERVPVSGESGEDAALVGAVMSGSRIYVSHRQGLMVLNARSGRVISEKAWPAMMGEYLHKRQAGSEGTEEIGMAVWQGFIRKTPGQPVYCFPLRNRVAGEKLFTMVGDGSLVMLRPRPLAK